jgi:hypothetical protein
MHGPILSTTSEVLGSVSDRSMQLAPREETPDTTVPQQDDLRNSLMSEEYAGVAQMVANLA